MHVILMGAQGAGKGTQAERLAPRLHLVHLSTGDLFRAEIRSESELGKRLAGILERGELVPDQLTLDIVDGRLTAIAGDPDRSGALFDGFPRTLAQAEGLDLMLRQRGEEIGAVVEIAVPRHLLVERLAGRRICPVCGTTYHVIFNPPAVDSVCDREGATLVQRPDDTPEAIERRLDLYFELTAPLLSYYESRGLLRRVDGDQSIDGVTDAIASVVELTGKSA